MSGAIAAPPLYVAQQTSNPALAVTDEIVIRVPKLTHDRGRRWPMIMWEAGSFDPQPPEHYRDLLARGLTQHIRLDEAMIPTAQALQAAGSPVIMMEGQGGAYPYSAAGDPRNGSISSMPATRLMRTSMCMPARPSSRLGDQCGSDPRDVATLQRRRCDGERGLDGLGGRAGRRRRPLRAGDPLRAVAAPLCRRACSRAEAAFSAYCMRKYHELVGVYMAGPVGEIFPGCSTTNWNATFRRRSTRSSAGARNHSARACRQSSLPTNPIAYGMTMFFDQWKKSYPLDREHVDQLYTHLLMREVSTDAATARSSRRTSSRCLGSRAGVPTAHKRRMRSGPS
jgi:hypothetical protein